MAEWMSVLDELATRAGQITLEYFQTPVRVETKENLTPVTVADRQTEQFLRTEILRRFPEDIVVGEEFGESGGAGRRRWIVDPIDGTKSFVQGVPIYGVMIGVEQDGEIIAGAVHIPAMHEMVVAERGCGCLWKGQPARVSAVKELSQAVVLTTDWAHNYKRGRGEAWDRLTSRARLVRTWGDCYGHLLVATGRAEVMVDPEMSPWDCAALKIILEEAGGTFTDYQGRPTIYADCAISTNGHLFDEVVGLTRG